METANEYYFSSGSLDSENENEQDNMDDNNIVADENNELFLFFLIYDILKANALDRSKLSSTVLKKLEMVETIIKSNFDDSNVISDSVNEEDEEDSPFQEIDFTANRFFQKLNRRRLSVNYSEFEPQLSPMEPILNELDEQESIHSQEETDSISSSSQISNTDTVLSQDDSDEINEDSDIQSQISSSSSDHHDETPSMDITSKTVQTFLRKVGNEEASPSVFDSNNHRVDFFLLPIFYCPQQCGMPTSHLSFTPNSYIADRYLITKTLGTATFSVTVEGIDMKGKLNERLCLKIIKQGEYFFDQSLDEIRILRYLNNFALPSTPILHLYDYFYYSPHLIIVTELLKDDLYTFSCKIDHFPSLPQYFTLPRISFIIKQILQALVFIHSQNIVHCDLKPENILFTDYHKATVKIADFGSSNFLSRFQQNINHVYIQSRSYRAPEIILGTAFDERIDIWSVGCITAELFTHSLLFNNASVGALLTSVSSLLGPIPEHLLKLADIVPYRQNGKVLVNLKKGGIWELDPPYRLLEDQLGTDDADFVDFIRKLLQWDPTQRLTASQALEHPFIKRYDHCEEYEGDLSVIEQTI